MIELKNQPHQTELLKMTILAFEDSRVPKAYFDKAKVGQLYVGSYSAGIHIPEEYPLELRFTATPGTVTITPSRIFVLINVISSNVEKVVIS